MQAQLELTLGFFLRGPLLVGALCTAPMLQSNTQCLPGLLIACLVLLALQGIYIVQLKSRASGTADRNPSFQTPLGAQSPHRDSLADSSNKEIAVLSGDVDGVPTSGIEGVEHNTIEAMQTPQSYRHRGPGPSAPSNKSRLSRRDKQLHGHFHGAADLRLVFLHIRKTGGSTVWALLRRLLPVRFKDSCLCSIKSPPMYASKCQAMASDYAEKGAADQLSVLLPQADGANFDLEIALQEAGYKSDWINNLTAHQRDVFQQNVVASSQVHGFVIIRVGCVGLSSRSPK